MLFSERNGLLPALKQLKPDAMPDPLRNSLWNELDEWLGCQHLSKVAYAFWKYFFKIPTDQIPTSQFVEVSYEPARKEIRKFFLNASWHQVYSLLEFAFSLDRSGALAKKIDFVMRREMAAYRVVNGQFVQITDNSEITELSIALGQTGVFSPISQHISTALAHLSDRLRPDYRNSVKESISAVESIARILCNKPNATLDEALKVVAKTHNLHPAVTKGFLSLYGYTSDADGIRHSLMSETDLTQEDAKFFLMACTSFVNYLKTYC